MSIGGDIGGLAAEAADWLVRLDSEDVVEADWLAFEAWLAADANHLAAYQAAESLWGELDDMGAQIQAGWPAKVVALDRRRAGAGALRFWPAAAAAALVVVVGAATYRAGPGAASQVYETARGETRDIALADGSHIFLNGGSSITVRLDRHVRRVEMADAQATFDVAKDPRRPFVIAVGDRQVRVVGTNFDIARHDGQMRLTVARGVVEVGAPETPQQPPVRLVRGQQLNHAEGRADNAVRTVEPDAAMGWRARRLVYSDERLDRVAADLSRAFADPVTAPGAASTLRFSGVLQLDDEAAVIRRLEAFLPVRAQRQQGAVVLVATGAAKD